MSRLFYLLVILLSTNIHAQLLTVEQAEHYSNELIKNDFLTSKGKDILLQQIEKGEIEVEHPSTVKSISYTSKELSRETIIQFCYSALVTERMSRLTKKRMTTDDSIFPKEPLNDSLGRTYDFTAGIGGKQEFIHCISPKTSVIGYTRLKTLNTFRNSGLIDEKIFNDCQAALNSKHLRDEIDLLEYMLARSIYYRYYDFNKREQLEYITSLVMHEILSEEGKNTLLNSYKHFQLKTIPEILLQSTRYVLVDLHAYEPNPATTYPIIFKAVQKLLPEFTYSNLTIQIEEEKETDLIRQDIKLSFNVDTIRYTHSFFHNYRKQNPSADDPYMEPSRVDDNFHKGINKWLTDIESPFRLYTINILDDDERYYGHRSVGLLLLKQGEDSLITKEVYLISRESFDERLSRKNIRKLLTELNRNDFFSHLTPADILSAEEKINSEEINGIEDVFFCFPKTLVIFDWETANLENPYEQITKEFMAASRGSFVVSNITDEFKKGWKKAKRVKYGFTMNGKRYEKMLNFNDDWLDPEFLELLKTALVDNNVNGQIYNCVDNGQESGYIFLTAGQYKFIQETYPDMLKGD